MKSNSICRIKHLFLFSLFFFLLSAFSLVSQAQILTIDKLDYAPGETVHISGSGWTPGEEVILQVFNETYPEYTNIDLRYFDWSVYADSDGNFSSSWPVEDPDLNTSLVLTADGQVSGFKYQVFFTDGDFRNVTFLATGLPATTNVTVTFSGIDKDGNPLTGSPATFAPPATVQIKPQRGSNLSFSFSSVPGYTFTTSVNSPFSVPNTGGNSSITAEYTLACIDPNNTTSGLSGNTICAGETGILTFNAIDESFQSPYTIVYGDGVNSWSQSITSASSTSFNVAVNPLTTTTYHLISITNGGGCTRTSGFGDATAQITVNALPSAPTANNYNAQYDGVSHTATATAPAGSTVTYYDSETVGNVVAAPLGINAGTNITVWAESISAAGCKSASRTPVTLQITKKTASIVALDKSKIFGQLNPELTATITGEVAADPIEYSLSTTALDCSIVGSYPITVTLVGGNDNYDITVTNAALEVQKKAATVVAAAKSKIFGAANPELTAVVDGETCGDAIEYTLATEAELCSNAGSYPITVTLVGGNDNYDIAVTNAELQVQKKTATVVADAKTKIFGAGNPELTAVVEGETCGDAIEYTLATTAELCSNVGSYPITVTLVGGNENYNITVTNAALEVQKKTATVVADAKTKIFGDNNPTLTATVAGEETTCAPLLYSLSTSSEKCSAIGDYDIVVTLGSNPNYDITPTNGILTINKRAATVTANNKTKIYGEVNPALTATVVNEVSCEAIDYTLSTTAVKLSPAGIYPINVTIGSNPNYTVSKTDGTLTIEKASTTTTLTLSGYQIRYMDMLTYTAVVKPLNTASPLEGSVTFSINGTTYSAPVVAIPGATDGSVQAMVIQQLPGDIMPSATNYTVTATFASTNGNYSGSTDSKSLKVDPKDASPYNASGFYVGDGFAWTTGSNSSTGTVTMVAALRDTNIPSGDLRGAKVSFYIVNGTSLSPISSAQNLPVGLVNPTDGSIGTASAIVQLNIGSLNSQSFKIAIKITGGYTNNPWDALSESIVTVSKPVTGGFITGGSSITNQNSSGYIKGATGLNTDFQFDIQYTKSGTNPKGKVDIMVRSYYDRNGILDSKLHTYLIRTNAISLLAISSPTATGTFSAKANMNEQLEDGTLVAVESGATFQMAAFQNACNQQIAITYYRKAGGIWFSSNWDAINSKSILQPVNAGSVVYVSGGGTCSLTAPVAQNKSAQITTTTGEFYFEPVLKAFPNPFTEQLNIQFSSATDTNATLEIFSVTGSKLQTLYNGPVKAGVLNTFEYKPRLVSSQIVIYRLNLGGALQTGKINYQERR